MTQARWQDRACATSVRANVWLGLAFGFGALELGTGCEVVGEIGADDLAASTSTSSSASDGSSDGSSDRGTATEDATKPTMTTGSSSTDESSSGDPPDTFQLDVGGGGSDATSSASTYTDETSTTANDGVESSSGAEGDAPPCCEAAMEPGCVDPELEACVCAADEFCCAEQWDAACVDVAVFGDCGAVCENMPVAPEPGECCTANDASPGCIDPVVQDCVCAADPYCCAYVWDDVCVEYVEQYECGTCD